MAAFWPQSLMQQVDAVTGLPIIGAKANFYVGGTSTPLSIYSDYGLATPRANPAVSDSHGRFPAVFLAAGLFRVRMLAPDDTVIYDVDNMPAVEVPVPPDDPTDPIDPTGVAKTGDMKFFFGAGTVEGWARCNGRTIGSAASGATETASDDCADLFELLWPVLNLTVSGGRGGSASADWAANKTITLPDMRGRVAVGLDQMGASAPAGVLTDVLNVGHSSGAQSITLDTTQMPPHFHVGTTNEDGDHHHGKGFAIGGYTSGAGAGTQYPGAAGNTDDGGAHTHGFETEPEGGGLPHSNVQPFLAMTVYIKI
ncbi:hypothetical protein [Xanthobacter sp. VNH20]|uniref:hypothetical protein n=1 Tax=Xanthobacter sp. VNH20 TaxID=3156616 RepID=UPI0032B33BCA